MGRDIFLKQVSLEILLQPINKNEYVHKRSDCKFNSSIEQRAYIFEILFSLRSNIERFVKLTC